MKKGLTVTLFLLFVFPAFSQEYRMPGTPEWSMSFQHNITGETVLSFDCMLPCNPALWDMITGNSDFPEFGFIEPEIPSAPHIFCLPVRPQQLGAVAVHMIQGPGWVMVTVDKDAYNPFQAAFEKSLLGHKKCGIPCPSGLTQSRSRVFRVQISCNRKNDRYQIFFHKIVP